VAPGAGLEPATLKLTASCSTIELPGNNNSDILPFSFVSVNIARGLLVFATNVAGQPAEHDTCQHDKDRDADQHIKHGEDFSCPSSGSDVTVADGCKRDHGKIERIQPRQFLDEVIKNGPEDDESYRHHSNTFVLDVVFHLLKCLCWTKAFCHSYILALMALLIARSSSRAFSACRLS
jgi:hypothetical protein